MTDYQGFWLGFVALFGVLPFVLGAGCGLVWAWQTGRRGARLVLPALLCGSGASLSIFVAVVFLFRA